MEVSKSSLCLLATMDEEERALLFTAVEMAWYQQPVRDSAGAEMKRKWTSLLEDLDNVQAGEAAEKN